MRERGVGSNLCESSKGTRSRVKDEVACLELIDIILVCIGMRAVTRRSSFLKGRQSERKAKGGG